MKQRYKAPALVWQPEYMGRVQKATVRGGVKIAILSRQGRFPLAMRVGNMCWHGPSYSTLYNAKRGAARWLVALGLV